MQHLAVARGRELPGATEKNLVLSHARNFNASEMALAKTAGVGVAIDGLIDRNRLQT